MSFSNQRSLSSHYPLFLTAAEMYCRIAFATLAVIVGWDLVTAQSIPSTTTAAELWNPWTWFWPYAKAAAEGYRDYYDKAQKATNELYQQVYKTNAFPWVTGNWGGSSQNNQGGQSGQNSQGGNTGQTTQDGQGGNAGQAGQGGNAGQTGQGGNAGQTGQGGNAGQAGQGGNAGQTGQGDATQNGGNQAEAGTGTGTGAQVEGNVQDDGTADAQANANVEGEEVNV